MNKIRTYSDFSLSFTPHPVTGNISMLYDADAVKASVRNLIMTMNYERPFHPEVGITPLLFELFSPLSVATIKQQITNLINTYEPRAILNSVDINAQDKNNSITITVNFTVINTQEPVVLNVILERVR